MTPLSVLVTEVACAIGASNEEIQILVEALNPEAVERYVAHPEKFTKETIKGQVVAAILFRIRLPRAAAKAIAQTREPVTGQP